MFVWNAGAAAYHAWLARLKPHLDGGDDRGSEWDGGQAQHLRVDAREARDVWEEDDASDHDGDDQPEEAPGGLEGGARHLPAWIQRQWLEPHTLAEWAQLAATSGPDAVQTQLPRLLEQLGAQVVGEARDDLDEHVAFLGLTPRALRDPQQLTREVEALLPLLRVIPRVGVTELLRSYLTDVLTDGWLAQHAASDPSSWAPALRHLRAALNRA